MAFITAWSNDNSFDNIFARQLEALSAPGDILIALSTSGNSTNLLNAADFAIKKKLNVISFTGNDGGKLKNKSFMFTAKLLNISRAEAKSLTEENSGKILSNVSKKLDYLVIGEKPTSKKVKQAKELNIKIISQTEWKKLLN